MQFKRQHMNKKIIVGYSIVSPLHLINFLTYLNSSPLEYDKIYIFINKYWSNNIIPQRYLNYCKSIGIEILFDNKLMIKIIDKLIKSNAELELVFVKNPSVSLLLKSYLYDKKLKIILIDEGVSSYAGNIHSLKATIRENGLIVGLKSLIISFVRFILILLSKNKLYKFSAFDTSSFTVNQIYKKNFKKVLEFLYTYKSGIKQDFYNSLLFCSQPWIELGVMTEEEYSKLLHELSLKASKLSKELVIKKHPADTLFNYGNYKVVNFDGCVEELVFHSKFSGVISLNSTSSLLISSCLDLESYILDFNQIKKLDKNLNILFNIYCSELK